MKLNKMMISTQIIKIGVLLLGLLLISPTIIGQNIDSTIRTDYFNKVLVITYKKDNVFTTYYVNNQYIKTPMVVFPDSMTKFCYNQTEFIDKSFHWPPQTGYLDIVGRITFGVLIDSSGCLKEVRLLDTSPIPENYKFAFIEEAEKVVWSMNCWIPAIENGIRVNTMKVISIPFSQ